MDDSVIGRIFDVQAYSVNDGPGIRTLIFLKGCTLNCKWCSNPESINPSPQLRYIEVHCKKFCRECINACPELSISIENMKFTWDNKKCLNCTHFSCVKSCPTEALSVCGEMISSTKLVEIIKKDIPFFGKDGGVTLSGGEPFAQPDFAKSLLKKCKDKGISTVVETALNIPWKNIKMSIPFIDFFIFDLKIFNTYDHKKFCGAENKQILHNIKRLVETAEIPILPRIPIIPGINDDLDNINAIGDFLKKLGLINVQLMPYMNLGTDKYKQIGEEYSLTNMLSPSQENLKKIEKILIFHGITCR